VRKKVFALSIALILFLSLPAGCSKPADGEYSGPADVQGQKDNDATPVTGNTKPAFDITAPTAEGIPLIEGITLSTYPRVNGSTACLPLLVGVMAKVCGITTEEAEPLVSISGGTGAVWDWLLYNDGMAVVYEAPEENKALIAEKNLDIRPYGIDALVFIVNKDNPVDNLTTEQLIGIYTGKITDWSEVGGNQGPIVAYQRNQESGSQTLFLSLLMKDIKPQTPPSEQMPGFMSGLIDAISNYDGSGSAIGFSVYYYAELMYTYPNLKILSVDGVKPSVETIAKRAYPFVNEFYLVIGNPDQDLNLAALHQWMLSEDARQLLIDLGYIPIF